MKITLTNKIKIRTTSDNEQQIIKQFTFANPKFQDAISFGRSTRGIDRNLCLIDREASRPMARLIAPIGILDYLTHTFIHEIDDQRRDNMEFMIYACIGNVCAEINQDQLQGKVLPVCVQKIQHEFNA